MKRTIYIFGLFLLTAAFTGCDDAVNSAMDNALYIEQAASRDEYDCSPVVLKEESDTQLNILVRMGQKLDHDVKVYLNIDEKLLEEHKNQYAEDFKIIPAEYRDVDGLFSVTIPANTTTVSIPVTIAPFETEGLQYALPVAITSSSDNIPLLLNQKQVIFQVQKAFTTRALWLDSKKRVDVTFPEQESTADWTVEMFVASDMKGLSSNIYGSPFLMTQCTSGMGLYMRFYPESNNCDVHCFNDQSIASVPEDNTDAARFTDGRWNHIAAVCENGTLTTYLNGKVAGTGVRPDLTSAIRMIGCNLGSEHHMGHLGLSEVRIWKVARSIKELKRAKFSVAEGASGLIAYWKFNDDNDQVVKDYSGNGFDIDLTTQNPVSWVTVRTNEGYTTFETVEE